MEPLGHESALELLAALRHDAAAGRGGIAVITGPLSCGRSELLQNLVLQSRADGADVVVATGSVSEQQLMGGVVDQLLGADEDRVDAATAIGDQGLDDPTAWPADRVLSTAAVGLAHRLCSRLLRLAGDRTTVVVVDNVQCCDLASQHVLAALARRVSTARVLVVLSCWTIQDTRIPVLAAQLSAMPYRSVELAPLATGLEASASAGDDRSEPPTDGTQPADGLVAGSSFGHAVLISLQSWGIDLVAVARLLALTGGRADPSVLTRLLGYPRNEVERLLGVLDSAGLLDGVALRHGCVADAVLTTWDARELAEAHDRIAWVLFQSGAGAVEVAPHLLSGTREPADWSSTTLINAGRRALAVDDVDLAERCANVVIDAGGPQRLEGLLLRLETAWRVGPAVAAAHAAELVEALAERRLTAVQGVGLVRLCLWAGDREAADAAYQLMTDQGMLRDPAHAVQIWAAYQWYALSMPNDIVQACLRTHGDSSQSWVYASTAVAADRGGWVDTDLPEQLLQSCDLVAEHYEVINCALTVLTAYHRLDVAQAWAERLLAESVRRRSTAWAALMRSHLAAIYLKQSRVQDAAATAESALTTLSTDNWGWLVVHPMSTLLEANALLGRQEHSEQMLRRFVPDPVDGPQAVVLIRARGRHHLSNGRRLAAIADFQRCQAILHQNGLELEQLVPWRLDLAEVNLQLGRSTVARQLVQQHLDTVKPKDARTQGRVLMLMALSRPLLERRTLLERSVATLERSGDRVLLIQALRALVNVYQELGELERARAVVRRANSERRACQLVDAESGAVPATSHDGPTVAIAGSSEATVGTTLGPVSPRAGTTDGPTPSSIRSHGVRSGSDPAPAPLRVVAQDRVLNADLSDAQRRVAELAALGHTNQEISRKLYITVSTVEQHLTRIFRKLDVQGRDQLAEVFGSLPQSQAS